PLHVALPTGTSSPRSTWSGLRGPKEEQQRQISVSQSASSKSPRKPPFPRLCPLPRSPRSSRRNRLPPDGGQPREGGQSDAGVGRGSSRLGLGVGVEPDRPRRPDTALAGGRPGEHADPGLSDRLPGGAVRLQVAP